VLTHDTKTSFREEADQTFRRKMSRSVRKQKEQAAAAEREVAETEAEAEEEEGSEPVAGFQEIDKLQELGVNVADIKKLKVGGCHTLGCEELLLTNEAPPDLAGDQGHI